MTFPNFANIFINMILHKILIKAEKNQFINWFSW